MKTGLFIGRFQPFHNGHLSDIKNAFKEVDKLIIGIGSSQYKRTTDNPFSYQERLKMVEAVLSANRISNVAIYAIPDYHDDEKWVKHIEEKLPKFDVVFTGNDWVEKIMVRKFRVKRVKMIKGISSTIIRDLMKTGTEWKKMVPEEIIGFLNKYLSSLSAQLKE